MYCGVIAGFTCMSRRRRLRIVLGKHRVQQEHHLALRVAFQLLLMPTLLKGRCTHSSECLTSSTTVLLAGLLRRRQELLAHLEPVAQDTIARSALLLSRLCLGSQSSQCC
eukprot:m.180149 g.180149  ORF g.180149 m.180149 type:complete len:110 (+) comp10463_c0_seq2:27-356(+)